MNNLKPFATLNLTATPAHHHTQVLLAAAAQCFVIATPETLDRIGGALASLRKTQRVRLGIEGEIMPGTRVRLTGGPHEGRDGVAVCLPVFGGGVGTQYWVRLTEEGGLSEPVSASPEWLATLPPLPRTRPMGAPRDLRSFSSEARYGRRTPDFERLDEVVLRALDTAYPEDIIVLGAEEYREHVAELMTARGRSDLHLAVAPHSYLAKALITDGLSLGSTGVFLGYADSRGTAVINVENSCTQTLPAGSYYLLNDFTLANCPDDELLAHLTDSPPYEYKFDSCGHCHAQGFHLNTHQWPCPLCGSHNAGELYGRIAAGERIDFGPTQQQLDAAYELIERHQDFHPPGMKVVRITAVRDLRDAPVGRRTYVSAGMFAAADEEAPDECPAVVSKSGTFSVDMPGVRLSLLSNPGHTREETLDGLMRTLGPKVVAAIKAGEDPASVAPGGRHEPIIEEFLPEPFQFDEQYVPFKARRVSGAGATPEKTLRSLPRPSRLPPADETRLATVSHLVERDGRELDPTARLLARGGAARLEAGMYLVVPAAWPGRCAVMVLHSACVALAPEGCSPRVFPAWPQDTSRAASEEYDRRLAAQAERDVPKVIECGGRRIIDISNCTDFRAALRAALPDVREGDALVVHNEDEQREAREALSHAGGPGLTVALSPTSGSGTPVALTGGTYAGENALLVGGTGEPGHFFVMLPGHGLARLGTHDFRLAGGAPDIPGRR